MVNKEAEGLKDEGNKAYGGGNFSLALTLYSQAINLDPTNHVYFSNRSAAYVGLGQQNRAISDANECLRLNPDFAKGYYRRATALAELELYDLALESCNAGLKKDPKLDDLKRKKTEIENILKKHKPTRYDKKLSPGEQEKAIGNDHFKESRYTDAIKSYSRAIELTDDPIARSTIFSNRAACYAQNQNWDFVISDCNDSIALNTQNVKAYLRRGLAFESIEKYKQALEDMKRVKELDPSAVSASQAMNRINALLR